MANIFRTLNSIILVYIYISISVSNRVTNDKVTSAEVTPEVTLHNITTF